MVVAAGLHFITKVSCYKSPVRNIAQNTGDIILLAVAGVITLQLLSHVT